MRRKRLASLIHIDKHSQRPSIPLLPHLSQKLKSRVGVANPVLTRLRRHFWTLLPSPLLAWLQQRLQPNLGLQRYLNHELERKLDPSGARWLPRHLLDEQKEGSEARLALRIWTQKSGLGLPFTELVLLSLPEDRRDVEPEELARFRAFEWSLLQRSWDASSLRGGLSQDIKLKGAQEREGHLDRAGAPLLQPSLADRFSIGRIVASGDEHSAPSQPTAFRQDQVSHAATARTFPNFPAPRSLDVDVDVRGVSPISALLPPSITWIPSIFDTSSHATREQAENPRGILSSGRPPAHRTPGTPNPPPSSPSEAEDFLALLFPFLSQVEKLSAKLRNKGASSAFPPQLWLLASPAFRVPEGGSPVDSRSSQHSKTRAGAFSRLFPKEAASIFCQGPSSIGGTSAPLYQMLHSSEELESEERSQSRARDAEAFTSAADFEAIPRLSHSAASPERHRIRPLSFLFPIAQHLEFPRHFQLGARGWGAEFEAEKAREERLLNALHTNSGGASTKAEFRQLNAAKLGKVEEAAFTSVPKSGTEIVQFPEASERPKARENAFLFHPESLSSQHISEIGRAQALGPSMAFAFAFSQAFQRTHTAFPLGPAPPSSGALPALNKIVNSLALRRKAQSLDPSLVERTDFWNTAERQAEAGLKNLSLRILSSGNGSGLVAVARQDVSFPRSADVRPVFLQSAEAEGSAIFKQPPPGGSGWLQQAPSQRLASRRYSSARLWGKSSVGLWRAGSRGIDSKKADSKKVVFGTGDTWNSVVLSNGSPLLSSADIERVGDFLLRNSLHRKSLFRESLIPKAMKREQASPVSPATAPSLPFSFLFLSGSIPGTEGKPEHAFWSHRATQPSPKNAPKLIPALSFSLTKARRFVAQGDWNIGIHRHTKEPRMSRHQLAMSEDFNRTTSASLLPLLEQLQQYEQVETSVRTPGSSRFLWPQAPSGQFLEIPTQYFAQMAHKFGLRADSRASEKHQRHPSTPVFQLSGSFYLPKTRWHPGVSAPDLGFETLKPQDLRPQDLGSQAPSLQNIALPSTTEGAEMGTKLHALARHPSLAFWTPLKLSDQSLVRHDSLPLLQPQTALPNQQAQKGGQLQQLLFRLGGVLKKFRDAKESAPNHLLPSLATPAKEQPAPPAHLPAHPRSSKSQRQPPQLPLKLLQPPTPTPPNFKTTGNSQLTEPAHSASDSSLDPAPFDSHGSESPETIRPRLSTLSHSTPAPPSHQPQNGSLSSASLEVLAQRVYQRLQRRLLLERQRMGL